MSRQRKIITSIQILLVTSMFTYFFSARINGEIVFEALDPDEVSIVKCLYSKDGASIGSSVNLTRSRFKSPFYVMNKNLYEDKSTSAGSEAILNKISVQDDYSTYAIAGQSIPVTFTIPEGVRVRLEDILRDYPYIWVFYKTPARILAASPPYVSGGLSDGEMVVAYKCGGFSNGFITGSR